MWRLSPSKASWDLGVQPGAGRKSRLTESERVYHRRLPSRPPPAHLVTQREGMMVARDESGSAHWSLDAAFAGSQKGGHLHETQPDPPYPTEGRGEVAADTQLWHASRQGLCPQRTAVVTHYSEPPEGLTTDLAPTNFGQ
jgi:hypothetical protein